jgi:mannonate dehydratase
MHVGYRIHDLEEESLRFRRQIGCTQGTLNVPEQVMPAYGATGILDEDEMRRVKERVESFGLTIPLINVPYAHIMDAYLGKPRMGEQIAMLRHAIEVLGRVGIPLLGLSPFNGGALGPNPPGYTYRARRGGYRALGLDLALAEATMDAPEGQLAFPEVWANQLTIYRAIIPVAEASGVTVVQHGNDPPLRVYRGLEQPFTRFADWERLFHEVPSPNNGITFCVGTRFESGEDVLAGIRLFGRAGKIHHVHFRNVVGPIPAKNGYWEVLMDEGDLDMEAVVEALFEVGYTGMLNVDHLQELTGDTPDQKAAIAYSVGYTMALVQRAARRLGVALPAHAAG